MVDIVTNAQAKDIIGALKAFAEGDRHGGIKRYLEQLWTEAGFVPYERATNAVTFPKQWTAIQVSFFDNWPNGKAVKNKPFRYAVTVDVETKPAKRIKFNSKWPTELKGTLFSGKLGETRYRNRKDEMASFTADELSTKAWAISGSKPKPIRNPISDEYRDTLYQIGQVSLQQDSDMLCAPLMKLGGDDGTVYADHCYVIVWYTEGKPPQAIICANGGEPIQLMPFDDKLSGGGEFRISTCKYQSRTSNEQLLANWSTNRLAVERKFGQ